MSERGHNYTFSVPDGPYWEAKRRREDACPCCGGYQVVIDLIGVHDIDGEEVPEYGEAPCPLCWEDES